MSKHISEESKGPRKGHAAGDTSIEQQASQLASDIKYKARQKMKGTSGSNLSPGQVQALYRSLLNSSPAPSGVKAIVKKKLFGEEIDRGEKLVAETLENKTSTVLGRVFVEGGGQKVEVEEIEEAVGQKFVIRVTDKATGNTTYRKADRAKIAELRANKNISSVEITGRKKADDAYGEKHEKKYGSSKGKNTVGDKDGDGTKEPDRHEYAGVKDRAIKKAMAKEEVETVDEAFPKVPIAKSIQKELGHQDKVYQNKDGSRTTVRVKIDKEGNKRGVIGSKTVKGKMDEEIIYEKEESGEKKLDVMKGKNTIKVNPTIGESIRAELDALKAQKVEEAAAAMKAAGPSPEERQQLMNKDKMLKLPLNYSEEAGAVRYCPKCDKDETRDECRYGGEYWDENSKPAKAEDPREEPTKATLFKNKLRARGIQVAGLSISPRNMKTYDDLGEESVEEGLTDLQRRRYLGRRPDESKERLKRSNERKDKKAALAAMEKQYKGMKAGIYNSYEAEGEMTEEASDRARDEHQMRGGMAARKDYDRPPAKKLSNKELGIKPGKTWVQKQMEKK
jgi:hypothetical protein